jgi:hypothetical protein
MAGYVQSLFKRSAQRRGPESRDRNRYIYTLPGDKVDHNFTDLLCGRYCVTKNEYGCRTGSGGLYNRDSRMRCLELIVFFLGSW